jgi:hypothetical protein
MYSFGTLVFVFYILVNYKVKQKASLVVLFMLVMIAVNLASYSYAFIKSAPNNGDWFVGTVIDDKSDSIKVGQYVVNMLINCPSFSN